MFLDRFAAAVARTPDAPAVVCEGKQLTYRELADRSAQIAAQLQPETCVALYAERSIELVVGMLGILRAGAAFVPMDPINPVARLRAMASAVDAKLVVRTADLDDLGLPSVLLDARGGACERVMPRGESLAYAIFTSGSTGTPKPVGIEHRQLENYIAGVIERFALPADGRYAIVSTFAADLGYTMVFPALALGGALHVITRARSADPTALGAYMTEQRIDCLKIVPSHLSALVANSKTPAALLPAQRLILGGEASSAAWAHELAALRPGMRVFNHYGPTETTIGVITNELVPGWRGDVDRVPLGRPLPGVDVHLIDGELYIGGAQVARGYLGRPEQTAERFVASPHGRLYKTGDVVRELADGTLDFLGRADDQVKIRGYRVEPNEVAAVLREHPDVRDVAIVPSDNRLFAYVVPSSFIGDRYVLPNNLAVAQLHRHETDYIFKEVFELQAYLRHGIELPDGAQILDVGANIGLFSVFASQVCKAPRILAFEPNPTVCELLSANLEAYVPNGRALPYGLAAKPGTATFTFFTGYSLLSGLHADAAIESSVVKSYVAANIVDAETSRLAQEAGELIDRRFEAQQFEVELRTLHEVMAGIDHVDLLKINVEKAEVEVLSGLAPEDWARIDQIVAEIDLDANVGVIEAMLREHDFEYVIDQDALLANTALRYVYAVRRASGKRLGHARHREILAPPVLTSQRLLAYCRERLPEYMVPSAFTLLPHLPLTPNGKLDRAALPKPQPKQVQLEGATIQELAAIWRELLGCEVEASDSFFDIGGTSLLAIRLEGRIVDRFGVSFPLSKILSYAELGQMAAAIDSLLDRAK